MNSANKDLVLCVRRAVLTPIVDDDFPKVLFDLDEFIRSPVGELSVSDHELLQAVRSWRGTNIFSGLWIAKRDHVRELLLKADADTWRSNDGS